MRRFIFLVLTTLAFLPQPITGLAQANLNWARSYPGQAASDTHLATDLAGNIYVAGSTADSAYTLIKYNAAGAQQWAITGNPGSLQMVGIPIVGIGTDNAGNIYLVTNTAYGGIEVDAFNGSGSLLWNHFESFYQLNAQALVMTVDGSGNVFVGGAINPSYYVRIWDFMTMRVSGGALRWMSTFGGSGNQIDEVSGMVADGSGNVYVTGTTFNAHTYKTTIIIKIGSPITLIRHDSSQDITTIKYDSLGNATWTSTYNGGFGMNDIGGQIARDPSSGNVYVTGRRESASSLCGSVIGYSPAGDRLWVISDSSTPLNLGIAVDPSGNIITAGFPPNGSIGFDVSKYSSAGALSWNYATSTWPIINNSPSFRFPIALDREGNCYLTGIAPNYNYFMTVEVAATGALVWSASYPPGGQGGGEAIAIFTPRAFLRQPVYPHIIVAGPGASYTNFTTLEYQYQPVNDAYRSDTINGGSPGFPGTVTAQLSNFPNPFHRSTTIAYSLFNDSHVTLQLYDQSGKLVAILFEGDQKAGIYTQPFTANRLAAGVYFYRITATSPKGNSNETKTMAILP
jgi:Beta-propeller repeat